MKSVKLPGVIAFSAFVLGLAISASATTITFTTGNGSTVDGNLPIDAQVTLTTSTNLVTLTLSNLQTKITDIDQTLSGVSFDLSNQKDQHDAFVQFWPGTHDQLEPYVQRRP